MKKHSVRFILLLLIVSVLVISCDDAISRLNQDETDKVAFAALLSVFHSIVYVEPHEVGEGEDPISLVGIGDEGLEIIPGVNELTLTWTNFDVGASVQTLLDDNDVPEIVKGKFLDLFAPGQITIVLGTAHADFIEDIITVQMKLKVEDLQLEGVPSGVFEVKMTMYNLGSDDEDASIEAKVEGKQANIDMEDMQ